MALGSDNDRDRPVYMIGVAAQLAGMHPQTLRSYARKRYLTGTGIAYRACHQAN